MMLEIKDISKNYGEKCALNHINLTLTGGVYGLLGPNGAGKSTLMNIITDNLQPDKGEVLWDGVPVRKMGAAYRSMLGYAPQQQGLYEAFTGRRFLSYMGTLKKIPGKEMKAEISRVAESVNLVQMLDKPIGSYSGGMKQRLLVAQAMMGDPKLMIMDEPTAGLDPKERVRIREKIKELSEGKIILVATHVVSDIQSIAKEIIILKSGNLVDQDTVANLCSKYAPVERIGGLSPNHLENASASVQEGLYQIDDLEQVYMHIFGEEERFHV